MKITLETKPYHTSSWEDQIDKPKAKSDKHHQSGSKQKMVRRPKNL